MLRHEVAQALRDGDHDVLRASEVGQARADDYQILQKSIIENRILVNLDEHFGDWVILPLRKHPGVIRLKINPQPLKTLSAFFYYFCVFIHPFNLQTTLSRSEGRRRMAENRGVFPYHGNQFIHDSVDPFVGFINFRSCSLRAVQEAGIETTRFVS